MILLKHVVAIVSLQRYSVHAEDPADRTWCHGVQHETEECKLHDCPTEECVDCLWSEWSHWAPDECPCHGLQERHRVIKQHNNYCGTPCEGPKIDTRCCPDKDDPTKCGLPACHPKPTDCIFGEWGTWSECDSVCDGGQRYRTREITRPAQDGGEVCQGEMKQMEACNEFPCHPKVDCELSDWSAWSSCSVSCNSGQQERKRRIRVPPQFGGKPCDGELWKVRGCNEQVCDKGVDCKWGEWHDWSACSVSCGGGEKMRHRLIATAPRGQGMLCEANDFAEVAPCNQQSCDKPIDCELGEWGKWSDCSCSCNGIKERNRPIKTYPDKGGKACGTDGEEVSLKEVESCNHAACSKDDFVPPEPQDCLLSDWTSWSDCSRTCDGGLQERTRTVAQHPEHGGEPCEGSLRETRGCNNVECSTEVVAVSIDCEFTEWDSWGGCSSSCGGGQRTRQRQIATMANVHGQVCPKAETMEVDTCNEGPCGAVNCEWAEWSDWSAPTCTELCERHRVIAKHAVGGGQLCEGPKVETKRCESDCHVPPVDCEWDAWEDWSACSVTCGGGEKLRQRAIKTLNAHGGEPCEGPAKEMDECNTQSCTKEEPLDCKIGDWGKWTACSAECGGGQQYRHREITQVARAGGDACPNVDLMEVRGCNAQACHGAVDCAWGEWTKWSGCSRSCGGGNQHRDRSIVTTPKNGGKACDANVRSEIAACNTQSCTGEVCIDGVFAEWGDWSLCSASCGDGFQFRSRDIAVQPNTCGKPVEGLRQEFRVCNRNDCNKPVVDCEFSEWTSYGDCSCECNGIKERTRRISIYPDNGGAGCEGPLKQVNACNVNSCMGTQPVDCKLSEWSNWTGCSAKCGGGVKTRERKVSSYPKNGGAACTDDLTEVTACNEQSCKDPVDCVLGEWDDWSSCSVVCGGGEQMRFRKIEVMPKSGGAPCEKHEISEIQPCNTQRCGKLEYCVWGDWGSWSNCTASCGLGQKWRKRHLDLVSHAPGDDDTVLATQILDQLFGKFTSASGTGSLFLTFFCGVTTALIALTVSYNYLIDESQFNQVSTNELEMNRMPFVEDEPVE